MKVSVPTSILVEGVGHAASVAASKSPKPILECIVLRADPNTGVSLEATDLDVGIRFHLDDAQVEEAGVVVVPASRLLAVVREVAEEMTTLTAEDGGLVLSTEGSRFAIRGDDAEDAPDLPYFPEAAAATLSTELVRGMVRRTAFATAKEAGRFALHGVLFKLIGSTVEMVATDGRRLARMTCDMESKASAEVNAIVAPKGLQLLERVIQGAIGDVELAVHDRQVLFRTGPVLIMSRLIDGSFPSLDGVIPENSKNSFKVPVATLSQGLRRAALMTTRDAMSVEFKIQPEELVIRSRARDVGEAKVEVPIQYDGPQQSIGFNPHFLQDALKVMEPAAEVSFLFSDDKAPCRMSDQAVYTYVVMPIALE